MSTASALLAVGWPSRGATTTDVSVDCPELTTETRSSLEARARAELTLKGLHEGHVRVSCGLGRVRVEFEPPGGPVVERTLALSGEPATWVEAILALLHEVTSTPAAAGQATVEGFPTPVPGEKRSEPSAPPPVSSAPEQASQPGPVPNAPLAATGAEPAARGRFATALGFEPGLGLCTELWSDEPVVLLGPCVAFGLRLARIRVAPTLGFAWASAPIEGIAVSTTTAGLEAAYGERWWVGGGLQFTWTHLEAPDELAPDAETMVEPALSAKGGYVLTSSVHRLVLGLGLRASLRYRDVRVDQTPVFRVPTLAPLASVEYRLAF